MPASPNDVDGRCPWCGDDPLYVAYHDTEWGEPVRDGVKLFEQLTLEGFQAGLSWITILRKREGFRAAFAEFDPEKIAAYDATDVERLVADPGIVRHRGKIEATISNAQAWREMGPEAFSEFIWEFVDGHTIHTGLTRMEDAVASTPASTALSKALKAKGFRFCGPTTVYAFMQAAGLVNDHMTTCWRYRELGGT